MNLTQTQPIMPMSAPSIDIGASVGERVSSLFRHIARALPTRAPDRMLPAPYMLRDIGLAPDQVIERVIEEHRAVAWRQ
jgi:hypothetical protein